MIDLGILGGDWVRCVANDINSRGQVAGVCWKESGLESRAILWTRNDGMVDLGNLDAALINCAAEGINGRGDVVGTCRATGQGHGFFWTKRHGMVDLGTLGGSSSEARAVNDRRQVAGFSHLSAGGSHAVIWTIR